MSSPDLIIGVDFGTTHTRVAWTNLRNETVTILHWPGRADSIKAVPSKLQNGPNREMKEWGFLCDDKETEDQVRESFKVYLDQDAIEGARRNGTSDVPENTGDAIGLVSDYLWQVYRHIKTSIEAVVGPWGDKNIGFIFSCPSTWRTLSTTNNFLEAIRAAGFGQESPLKHRATSELTSTEAVAVYAVSKPASKFEDGDVLIVCNAGGATTEVEVLELFGSTPMYPSLRQAAAVASVGNGSMNIDQEFQKLVQRKLDLYGSDTQIANHQDFSMRLARSKVFQSIKHSFGTTGGDISEYEIALHNLGLGITRDFCQPALRIDKGRMILSRAEIQTIFDQMIGGLCQLIDHQLLLLWRNRNKGQATILLNGGLGTSAYLYKQLQNKYASTSISVVMSEEPILVEVKGLVIERKQRLLTPAATLTSRLARASYGVLCRQVYDPKIHARAHLEADAFNRRRKWAVNQIEWAIRKVCHFPNFPTLALKGPTNRAIYLRQTARENGPSQTKGLIPNYSLTSLASYLVLKHRQIELLAYPKTNHPAFPSWVPDWSVPRTKEYKPSSQKQRNDYRSRIRHLNEYRISLLNDQETISTAHELFEPDHMSRSYQRPVKPALDENEKHITWLSGQESTWAIYGFS